MAHDVELNQARLINPLGATITPGQRRKALQVWLADDDGEVRQLLGHLLNKQPGIRCTRQFHSGEALLATLTREHPPDTLLLDLNLAGQSSVATLRRVKELAPSVQVLMMTMFSDSDDETQSFCDGASGFLLKSYEIKEIADLIREASSNPQAGRLFPTLALFKDLQRRCARTSQAGEARSKRLSLMSVLRRIDGFRRKPEFTSALV
jgi:DNA-binding NarL/FixJ family response regulator